jgi:hypothetical protein
MAEPMHGELLQHFSPAAIRDVNAGGDELEDAPSKSSVGIPSQALRQAVERRSSTNRNKPSPLGSVTKSLLSSENRNLAARG